MILIGQRLNSTSPNVASALHRRDRQFVAGLARDQAAAGAYFLDINTAALGELEEAEMLCWLAEVVQKACDLPLCLDSQNPVALRAALAICQQPPILNAFSALIARSQELLAVFQENPLCSVITVCYDNQGSQTTPKQRVEIAKRLVGQLRENQIPESQIILDPVTLPISCGPQALDITLETMTDLRASFPEACILAVPSNYSYGLSRRFQSEQHYAKCASIAGADVFLCDPRIWTADR